MKAGQGLWISAKCRNVAGVHISVSAHRLDSPRRFNLLLRVGSIKPLLARNEMEASLKDSTGREWGQKIMSING